MDRQRNRRRRHGRVVRLRETDARLLTEDEREIEVGLRIACDPRRERKRPRTVRRHQLRRARRGAPRERALRARSWRVHRRGTRRSGTVCRRAPRHAPARRERRDVTRDAGQAPARPPRRRSASGGGRRNTPRRRACHRSDASTRSNVRAPRLAVRARATRCPRDSKASKHGPSSGPSLAITDRVPAPLVSSGSGARPSTERSPRTVSRFELRRVASAPRESPPQGASTIGQHRRPSRRKTHAAIVRSPA